MKFNINLLKIKASNSNIFWTIAYSLFLFLLTSCLIDISVERTALKMLYIGVISLSLFTYLCKYKWQIPFRLIHQIIPDFILVCIIVFFQLACREYSPYFAIKTCLLILILKLLLIYSHPQNMKMLSSKSVSFCYIIFTALIIYNFAFSFYYVEDSIVFKSINDKNYTAVLMFLYFILCYHFKLKIGMSLGLIYFLFYNSSRSSILLFLSFLICITFREQIYDILQRFRLDKFWKIFIIITACIMGLSFYWIADISVGPLQPYRQGLNDESNKMRFTANAYACELIKKDYKLIYRGYGYDLKNVMGLQDKNYSNHPRVNGVRLVQPHNSIINVMLRLGVISGVLYFIIVASILDYLYDKRTLEYIFPYLLNSMFMHSLLDGFIFAIWIFIIFLVWIEKKSAYNED